MQAGGECMVIFGWGLLSIVAMCSDMATLGGQTREGGREKGEEAWEKEEGRG